MATACLIPESTITETPSSPSSESTFEWWAVQVWTGREHTIARHLVSRGYEVFLPCYRERRRWSDRVKVVDRPLFSGYLFCRVHADVQSKIVTSTGVIRIVGGDVGPIPIPAHEIESIQRIVAARLPAEPCEAVLLGRPVQIEVGALRGIRGLVTAVKNRHRLIVSVSLLQRAVAVELDPEWISVS
jgi:transcriptional antiterminator NusG